MRAFAEQIIATQSAEVVQMKEWLATWYPDRDTTVDYLVPHPGIAANVGGFRLSKVVTVGSGLMPRLPAGLRVADSRSSQVLGRDLPVAVPAATIVKPQYGNSGPRFDRHGRQVVHRSSSARPQETWARQGRRLAGVEPPAS